LATPFEDQIVRHAVSQVEVRAESQQNLDLLAEKFVDPGVTDQLENDNSQIVYGRRGTGKTHILKFIEQGLRQRRHEGRLGLYLDMRILGSGSLNVGAGRELHVRTTAVLRDILERIHNELMSYVTDPATEVGSEAYEALNGLVHAMQRTILEGEELSTEDSDTATRERSGGAALAISPRPEARIESGRSASRQRQATVARSGKPKHALYYQEVGNALNAVLDSCGVTHLTLLLDEWTSVPLEVQPLLADYLRRCFLAHPRICLKVASIRHRSQFHGQIDDNQIGFEIGADVAATLELDEHFVFERNRAKNTRLFAELLHRHLSTEASRQASSSDYLWATYGIADSAGAIKCLFSGDRAFTELVRAGEGVPRDFINVFSKAFFHAVSHSADKIDAGAVRTAASEWFGIDKADNLERDQENLLNVLAGHVVGKNRVTSFAVPKRHERHRLIQELVDLRLLHLVRRNWMRDHNNPGERCAVFRVDYGSYAPLMGTSRAPRLWSPNSQSLPLPLVDELLDRIPE
jgi:hypothetical protein